MAKLSQIRSHCFCREEYKWDYDVLGSTHSLIFGRAESRLLHFLLLSSIHFLAIKNFFLHSSISYILSSSFRLFSVNKRPLEKMWLKLWYLIHFFLSQFSHNLFNFFSLKLFFVGSLFSIRGVFIVKIRDNNNNNNIEWMQERLMAESDHQRSLIDSYIISLLGSGH